MYSQFAIESEPVIIAILLGYFFKAGFSMPIERRPGKPRVAQINHRREQAGIRRIIVRDALDRQQVRARSGHDREETRIMIYSPANLQHAGALQDRREPRAQRG